MDKILFVTHTERQCGVYQFGLSVHRVISKSQMYEFVYVECTNANEVDQHIAAHSPKAILYNFHPSTQPWAFQSVPQKAATGIKQIIIRHEPTLGMPDNASASISQDPTFVEHDNCYCTGRAIERYTPRSDPGRLTIGSFGFGFGGKGFIWLAEHINREFDDAIIKYHIAYAHYGDSGGEQARSWEPQIRNVITKPGIELQMSHDFMQTPQLLDWLSGNTMNAFLYEQFYGRGISSALDFALIARKPIAITKSYQFKHVYPWVPEICIENNTLAGILALGTKPIEKLCEVWSEENLIKDYERIITTVCR